MSVLDAFRLDGKVALVTGAGRGLGAAGARSLAEAGAHVVVAGRNSADLERVAEDIRAAGGSAAVVIVDVTRAEQVDEAFAAVARASGGIDVLVNNAGVTASGPVGELALDRWQQVLDVNLTGVFRCVQAFLRVDSRDRSRSVINVTSIAAAAGVAGEVAYSASKGGVDAMTRSLAAELVRHDVRVNALAPGYFATDMPSEILADEPGLKRLLAKVPQRRIAEPEEIGPPLVFLASDASRFMTGASLYFDGGYVCR